MKILKKGKPPSERKYRGKCMYCYCEVECTLDEVQHASDQREGDFDYVRCPTCNTNYLYVKEMTVR